MSILNISSFLISVRLNGKYFGTGFTKVPGGDDYRNRSVLSYHYYCIILSLIPVPGNVTIPIYDRLLCDDVEGPALFRSVQNDLIQLGGSAFLTEFGGCDDSPTCDEQLNWGLDGADQFLQSWAFWGDVLGLNKTINRIARIYAHAIAGKPLAMQYIAAQRTFYLSYYLDPNINQPTEIYVPSIQFPQQSYNVTVSSALKWRVDPTNVNIILVEPNEQLVKSKEQAVIGTIDIRPKM
jgi:endoglycosylceramidase